MNRRCICASIGLPLFFVFLLGNTEFRQVDLTDLRETSLDVGAQINRNTDSQIAPAVDAGFDFLRCVPWGQHETHEFTEDEITFTRAALGRVLGATLRFEAMQENIS